MRLRRYDDIGKVEGLETPDLEHYRPVLAASMRSSAADRGSRPRAQRGRRARGVEPAARRERATRTRSRSSSCSLGRSSALRPRCSSGTSTLRSGRSSSRARRSSSSYFALLAFAYTHAELSVVYPLARGLAPVLVLAGAVAFTGADTSARQVSGVALVGAGIMLVRGIRGGRGALLAVLIACVDRVVHRRRQARRRACVACRLPRADDHFHRVRLRAIFIAFRGLGGLRAEVGWKSVGAGIGTFAAYACVLAALAARLGGIGRRSARKRRARRDGPCGDLLARARDALAGGRRRSRRRRRCPPVA